MATENERLFVAIFENCEIGTIDWDAVKETINVPSIGAAQKRFSRAKAKVKASPLDGETDGSGEKVSTPKNHPKRKAATMTPGSEEDGDNEAALATPKNKTKKPQAKPPKKHKSEKDDAIKEENEDEA